MHKIHLNSLGGENMQVTGTVSLIIYLGLSAFVSYVIAYVITNAFEAVKHNREKEAEE